MRIYKNDRRIREAAGRAAGIDPGRVFVEDDHGCVIVNLPNAMVISPEERQRVKREIEAAMGGAIRVSLV
jgi:hypothetical protein